MHVAFQTDAFADGIKTDDIAPNVLIEQGTYIQGSCFRNEVSWLAPYRGPAVRRPMSGFEIKQESHAYIQVLRENVDAGGNPALTPVKLFNSVGDKMTKSSLRDDFYTDFIVQTVTEQRAEKYQVIETFGEPFIFLFGERPRTLQVSGLLLNTHDYNWRTEFWENYELYLRGTRCVENRARVYLSFDDIMVEGYILAANARQVANQPHLIPFNFTMFLTDYVSVGAQLFSVWEQLVEKNIFGKHPALTDEYIGALQDDVKSMTTGRAILVSESLREWLGEHPEEILGLFDERLQYGLRTAKDFIKDPKESFKKLAMQPTKVLAAANAVLPEGMIPNWVCVAAKATEELIKIASEMPSSWTKLISMSTPMVEAGLDAALPTRDNIAKWSGDGGDKFYSVDEYAASPPTTPSVVGDPRPE